MTWAVYVVFVSMAVSLFFVGATIRLHLASRKLHRVNTALALMELQEWGHIMFWRQRALTAERELKQLKETNHV